MQKIEVAIHRVENHHRILRKAERSHIKTVYVEYVADLIREHGVIFVESYRKPLSLNELCMLAEHHYKTVAQTTLRDKGQYEMAAALQYAHVTSKQAVDNGQGEKDYFIIFSTNLKICVSDFHYRMFKIKPLLRSAPLAVMQEKLVI